MARHDAAILNMRRNVDALLSRSFRNAPDKKTRSDQGEARSEQHRPRVGGRRLDLIALGQAPIEAVKRERQQKEQKFECYPPDHRKPSLSERFTMIAAVAPQIVWPLYSMA